MKFLGVIALLVLAVAQAHHVPQHSLRLPRFTQGYTYTYDAVFNVTAGVLGLSSQVSASVLRAKVKIYAETNTTHVLKLENVQFSGSVSALDNKFADVELNTDEKLTDRLSRPIKFRLEGGKVTSYTLSGKDDLESSKIKRSILRSLQMEIPENILRDMEKRERVYKPVMFNRTENTDYGVHISNYIITASPDVEYPKDTLVYNISRIDNCEGEWYPGYKLHHNFDEQGCPEVCRQEGEWKDNFYRAGCPSGFEPNHSPIKRTFNHQQSLSYVNGAFNPEMITTVEVHFAKMYDQDMEVLIRYHLHRIRIAKNEEIVEESGQETHEDLNKENVELDEDKIDRQCNYKKSREAVASAKQLLHEVSDLIVKSEPGSLIGEKIILLRDAMSTFTVADFNEMKKDIVLPEIIKQRSEIESVARQVWLEILPLVGTHDSLRFIVKYVKEELSKRKMLVWEAKELLESLPQNIERPDEDTIKEMEKLLEEDIVGKSELLHSAAYLTTGRIISEVCSNVRVLRQRDYDETRSWLSKDYQTATPEFTGLSKCPERRVSDIIKRIIKNLEETDKPEKIAVYVETLTQTGMEDALYEVTDYVHGTAQNMKRLTPKHRDFLRSVFIHALHNMVGRHPQKVMEVVLPIFFNATETPKLRNAAFGVIIRCQPSLSLLQRVATHTWFEKSREVGSFVTSTLESFGNSSLPCMQLLSHRIKEILPQVKRFSIGLHHAKNHMWSYFDDLRLFGLEGRFEYTPNNESIVPSTFYQALTYTMDSMSDSILQSSFNIEGLTHEMIYQKLKTYTNWGDIEKIKDREVFGEMVDRHGERILEPRTVEGLRLVTYHKLFYKNCYNYLNAAGIKHMGEKFYEIIDKYLKKSNQEYRGYLVKLFLPSTYHTKAVAKTLPYPVEFQMRQPVVLSLGVRTDKSMDELPTINDFDLHLKPSIHLSKVFTHQMKNLRDCKEVGVYHTHKISMAYPFQIKYNGDAFPNIAFKYKIPDNEKKILYYNTEAGTYAGKKQLETLPMYGTNVPIMTIPTPFKFERTITPVGMPPFHIEVETEDINLFRQKLPRTPTEALHLAMKNIMNAGWRRKSANITLIENRALWTEETEAVFQVKYHHTHRDLHRRAQRSRSSQDESGWRDWDRDWESQRTLRQSDDDDWNRESPLRQFENGDWTKKPSLRQSEDDDWNGESTLRQSEDDDWNRESPLRQSEDDDWNTDSPLRQFENGDWTRKSPLRQSEDDDWNKDSPLRQSNDEDWIQYLVPNDHESFSEFSENVQHLEALMLEQTPHINHYLNISITAKPLFSSAYVLMNYDHSYDKSKHILRVEAFSKRANEEKPYKVELAHYVSYKNKPNELRYGDVENQNAFGKQTASFRTSISWPSKSQSCPIAVKMTGNMTYISNRDLLNELLTKPIASKYFLPETHEECKRDYEDKRPLSPNCIKAIREYSALNRINMTIDWNKEVPQHFRKYAQLTDVYLKHYFFEHLYLKPEENDANRIHISMEYIDKLVDKPLANWEIRKPSETLTFQNIPIGNCQPFSSVYPVREAALLKFTNNSYPARCVLSDRYVQTYDLVTYPFKPENCHYVLSAHCTKHKNFAIIVRGSGEKREIHIHVANTKTVLLPRAEHSMKYDIIYNGGKKVNYFQPKLLDQTNEIYVYLERKDEGETHLRFIAKKAGINVLYDGKTVKIQVSLRYKGELCGLCSEFDGEEAREFRGMDRCLYTDPVDFAYYGAAVKRDDRSCPEHHRRGQRMCEDPKRNWDDDRHYTPTNPRDDTEPLFPRNVVIYRGDEVCFSVRPVLSCGEGIEPSETESQRIGFHCLPKDDLTAKKLIAEAEWRPLDELRRKSVDHAQTVEVPRKC